MSLNTTLLIVPLVDFITGKIIEAGAKGDAAKLTARAEELIAINTALSQLNSGDSVAGLAALQSALNTTAMTPGEGLALQSLFASIGNQVALINTVAGGTLLGTAVGSAATAIASVILSTATSCAKAYVTKYSAPVAAAQAAPASPLAGS